MNLVVIGINHKSAPIEIRERISFSSKRLCKALGLIKGYDTIREAVILSTCNRVEFYLAVGEREKGVLEAQDFLCNFHNVSSQMFASHLYVYHQKEALGHLFRVATSLDSMVIGETQIFGQVKDAYRIAKEAGVAGKMLCRIFEEAARVAKAVRSRTRIGEGALSVSSVAISLAKKTLATLKDKKVLIIGAGKIAELAVRDLYSQGIQTVIVANRTLERAKELARIFSGTAINFKEISQYLKESDIVISSTSAPHLILTYEQVHIAMQQRHSRPLFLIDLGLPRNISPQVTEVENTHLYNLDDLTNVCDANLKERLREARKAQRIIEGYLAQSVCELLDSKAENLIEADIKQ
jgi:glutamyl-tRNA reductase